MKRTDIENILVPVDFWKRRTAIETAQRLAQRFGAAVHFVHVPEFFYPVGFMAPGAPMPFSMITFRQDDADRVRTSLGNRREARNTDIKLPYAKRRPGLQRSLQGGAANRRQI